MLCTHSFSSIPSQKLVLYNDCQTIVNYLAHISVSELPIPIGSQLVFSNDRILEESMNSGQIPDSLISISLFSHLLYLSTFSHQQQPSL